MLNVAKWQSGVVARAEPNSFELCQALATSAKPEWRWDKPNFGRSCSQIVNGAFEEVKKYVWMG